jgi:hypothetical protein
MVRWKPLLEKAIEEFEDRDSYGGEYRFAAPATTDEIARLEQNLGSPLHPDLRSMLLEFNGVAYRDKYWGPQWRPLYLSVSQMLEELQDYFANSGNPLPAADELRNVAFFAQQNGFGVVYAVCSRNFGDFTSGQVLALDHETGEFALERESLEEFVSDPSNCTL